MCDHTVDQQPERLLVVRLADFLFVQRRIIDGMKGGAQHLQIDILFRREQRQQLPDRIRILPQMRLDDLLGSLRTSSSMSSESISLKMGMSSVIL